MIAIRCVLFLLVLAAVTSCSRDPNVVKARYLESGNRYFEKGKTREAIIMYRKAIQTDGRYGEAYYRLAKAELKRLAHEPIPVAAVAPLRRANELLPDGSPQKRESQIHLLDIYFAYLEHRMDRQVKKDAEDLLGRLSDPQSFDGHRLRGRLHLVEALEGLRRNTPSVVNEELPKAVAEFEAANRIKPNQTNLTPYLARALITQKRFDEAEKLYRGLVAENPHFLAGYAELYVLLRAFLNRPDDAEQVLKEQIRNNPKEHALLLNLAQHYYDLKKREEVVKVLEELKQRAKEYPQAYEKAGDFYFRLGDGAEAIRQYEEGLKSGVGNKSVYKKRMIEVYMAQGKRDEARKVNDEIREADPKDADAMALQAILLLDKGEIESAVSQLRTVVSRAPDNFVAHFNLGRGLLLKGEVENARARFAEAVRLRPQYLPARVALAQVELSQREFSKALKTAEETLQFDPSNQASRLIRSAANLGLGNRDLARQELADVLRVSPNNKDALFQMGLLHVMEKRFREAEEYYRRCYELNPANARGLMGQLEAIMSQNQGPRALQVLTAEVEKFPTRLELRVARANLLARTARYEEAIAEYHWLLDRLDKKAPMAGDIHLRLGETLRLKGDIDGAIASLQKAREVLPANSLVLNTLALLLDGAGRKEEAKKAYEDTIRLEPENAIALNNLAFIIANMQGGDLDLALTYAQRARQRLPQVPEVADTLGLIYLKKNLPDDAIQIFRQCVAQSPKFPTYRYHLGMALHQKGDMIRAKEELQTALAHGPNKEEEKGIRDLLDRIG